MTRCFVRCVERLGRCWVDDGRKRSLHTNTRNSNNVLVVVVLCVLCCVVFVEAVLQLGPGPIVNAGFWLLVTLATRVISSRVTPMDTL